MDPIYQKKLDEFRNNFTKGLMESELDLYVVEEWISKFVLDQDLVNLKAIRNHLELMTFDNSFEIGDIRSFLLGKVHTIIEIASYCINMIDSMEKVYHLGEKQKKVLKCLKNDCATPSKLMKFINVNNKQQMSNILAHLRADNLVSAEVQGKNRFYSLTLKGHKALEHISKQETQVLVNTFNKHSRTHEQDDVFYSLPQAFRMGKLDEDFRMQVMHDMKSDSICEIESIKYKFISRRVKKNEREYSSEGLFNSHQRMDQRVKV